MKKLFFLLLITGFSFYVFAQSDSAQYAAIETRIKQQYAPDSRSVYFKTEIREDSLLVESSSKQALEAFLQQSKVIKNFKVFGNLLPDSKLGGKIYGVATVSVTNNRKSPSHSAELVTQLLLGTPVQILKKEGFYYLVRSPEGYLSYVDPMAIRLMDEQTFQNWRSAPKIIYTSDMGYAYTNPGTAAPRVSDLVKGNILQLIKEDDRFYQVVFPDQRQAFIPKTDAQPYQQWLSLPAPTAAQILSTAKSLMGVPYLWGGTSIKGVDCSGFTRTSYFLNGILIPRDASQQALAGTAIDIADGPDISLDKCLKNLRSGDLLFFSSSKRKGISGGRVTHVAIYMGNMEYIQSAGMVRVSSLDPAAANYDVVQSPALVSARRILTDVGQPQVTKVGSHPWYTPK